MNQHVSVDTLLVYLFRCEEERKFWRNFIKKFSTKTSGRKLGRNNKFRAIKNKLCLLDFFFFFSIILNWQDVNKLKWLCMELVKNYLTPIMKRLSCIENNALPHFASRSQLEKLFPLIYGSFLMQKYSFLQRSWNGAVYLSYSL